MAMTRTDDDSIRRELNDRRIWLRSQYQEQLRKLQEAGGEQDAIDDLAERIAGIDRWLEIDKDYAN
jgi:hypothetical protein